MTKENKKKLISTIRLLLGGYLAYLFCCNILHVDAMVSDWFDNFKMSDFDFFPSLIKNNGTATTMIVLIAFGLYDVFKSGKDSKQKAEETEEGNDA